MNIDGISTAHRGTWSKLNRLHTATIVLPMHTKHIDDADRRPDRPTR
ncbi:hypothetical protein EDF24_3462 [Curtobacterium sp. PhB130]|nr:MULTISPECIES: hypothetical protein [unclassified Curtobacterium]ROP65669.1 hypothetical protein EDF55_0108 [Curtobacterium sp. ZW137]ROS72202.1 hypothetical protein EDF24_3462 [Curtobacterium sp. PhB130]TCK63091.1 hypothetical protein EDF27_2756 [Curtobacterium sp. PhB136]